MTNSCHSFLSPFGMHNAPWGIVSLPRQASHGRVADCAIQRCPVCEFDEARQWMFGHRINHLLGLLRQRGGKNPKQMKADNDA